MADLQQRGPTQVARKRRKVWISAMLLSTVGHLLVMPALLQRLAERPEPQLELTYLDPDVPTEGPAQDGPTAETPPSLPTPPSIAKSPEPKEKKPETPPDEKVAERREKKPEPEKPKPENKPLDVAVLPHLKMVDQDQFPDEDDNKDARFLAQNQAADDDTPSSDVTLPSR